ncbi:methyltransferase RsmF C-terminal domain-like protein [Sediminibacterium sp.]|uniref:methyltransferase RsmF C-terminal domain-like protein n=1 Tax=Sediminibacterium sp. TaxID=1917865 RepID=UPI003F6E983A
MDLPKQLIDSLANVKGFDKAAFEAIHASGEQVTSIRLNPFKPSLALETIKDGPVPWCQDAFYLKERPSFTMDPLFHAGAYYVQEASSMFLAHTINQLIPGTKKGLKILDLCAAPGGKTTLLASVFSEGMVVSNEVIKSRAAILVENVIKWGLPNMVVTNNDPEHFKDFTGYFDVIVVDAPCSGSGLFRKDKQAIEEWSEQNVVHCSQRQERILSAILPCLKQGGFLIYSTCSYSVQEDEAIADWLVKDFQLASCSINIQSSWNIIATQSPQHHAWGYRFYPNLLKGEGFFLAAFKQTHNGFSHLKEASLTTLSKTEMLALSPFIQNEVDATYFKQNNSIRRVPAQFFTTIQELASRLYIKKAGIEIGEFKGKDLIPSHEWAVSTLPKNGIAFLEVNKEQALLFLKRASFTPSQVTLGWNWVVYEGVVLGLVKVLPNRINNYYPAEWRILKD